MCRLVSVMRRGGMANVYSDVYRRFGRSEQVGNRGRDLDWDPCRADGYRLACTGASGQSASRTESQLLGFDSDRDDPVVYRSGRPHGWRLPADRSADYLLVAKATK